MSLLNQIKADQLAARKARNGITASLLTTLIGEASIIGKNAGRETTDPEVVGVIKKFINNIDICLESFAGEAKVAAEIEKGILGKYMPVQITKEQMFEIIKKIRATKGSKLEMKDIMQAFKTQFAGMYDGKVLSNVAKEYLAVQV
jgi:uncharacterized protein YqeY